MRSDASRNHEAILSAAIEVLAAAPGASMRQLADASGTGRTTLYRHFPDREALVAAIYDRVYAEADTTIARALRTTPDDDPVAMIADLAAELSGFGDRYRFLESHAASAPSSGAAPTTGAGADLLTRIADEQRRGRIRSDLEADWLFEAMAAIITRAASRRDAPDARARLVRGTMRSLLAPSDP